MFLREIFSEDDGQGSISRVLTTVAVVMAMIWVTKLVWINHNFPDFVGLTGFISSLYFINRAHAVAEKFVSRDDAPKQDHP